MVEGVRLCVCVCVSVYAFIISLFAYRKETNSSLVYFRLVTKVVAFLLLFFLHIYIQARYPHKAFFVLDLDSFDLSPRVPREKRHLVTVLVSHREIPLLHILLMGDNGAPLLCSAILAEEHGFFAYNFFLASVYLNLNVNWT